MSRTELLAIDQEIESVEVYERQAELGKLMAHPVRIEIVTHLKDGEKNVAGLLELMLDVSKTNLSQHLAMLRAIGILRTRKEGSFVYYRLASKKITQACCFMRDALTELAMDEMITKDKTHKLLYKIQADTCRVISNTRRLMILHILQNGEMSVSHITEVLGVPQSSISQHLTVLRRNGILQSRRKGTTIYYHLASLKISLATEIMREMLMKMRVA